MRDKSIFIFIFLISCLSLQAQITPLDTEGNTGPTDSDEYPLSFNFMVGLPGGGLAYQRGYSNIREFFSGPPTNRDLERVDEYLPITFGLRYKRVYLQFRALNRGFSGTPLPLSGDRFLINNDFQAASFDLGYALLRGRNSELIVRGGAGLSRVGITVIPVQNNDLNFNDIKNGADPAIWAPIYHENPFWEASLELWIGRPKGRASIGESIRLGIRQGFEDTEWQIIGSTAVDAPMDRLSQIFLEVNFHLSANLKLK